MNTSEKLEALLKFLGPELIPQYSGLIRDIRKQIYGLKFGDIDFKKKTINIKGESNTMKKTRIVICVEGGNVVSIYATPEKAKELDIEVVDYDNLEAGGMTAKEASDYGLKATDGLKDVL